MSLVLVALLWFAAGSLLAFVLGAAIRLADVRAGEDAWRVPLLDAAGHEQPV